MKTLHLSIIISTIAGLVVIGVVASTTSPSNVTIKTDWPSYAGWSTITVSGKVNPIQPHEKVMIQVFYADGALYNSSQIQLIDDSNLYSFQFTINPIKQGTYDFTIHATYAGKTASTTFEFTETRYPSMHD
jgi:hypothetical protein